MTKVEFFFDDDGNILKYIMNGHTGYDEHGKDIVCAAVSVLAQTGLMSLLEFLNLKISYLIEDGYIKVILPKNLNKDDFEKSQIVLNTVLIGIKSVAESYPDYISLDYREV
ncbi:MAG: ribosomal-processing cysteine protease Prp [Senegalia sp. (in: firmicutes)]|uniref:ribosomal-processing cysteine protease Prp n=1 Tax=Senegalia sp. (in: firmicutes) TaxID=1924098 RepID=UPI003F9AC16E